MEINEKTIKFFIKLKRTKLINDYNKVAYGKTNLNAKANIKYYSHMEYPTGVSTMVVVVINANGNSVFHSFNFDKSYIIGELRKAKILEVYGD